MYLQSKACIEPNTNHFFHLNQAYSSKLFEDSSEKDFTSSPEIFIDDSFKNSQSPVRCISEALTQNEPNKFCTIVKHPNLIQHSQKIAKVFTIHREKRQPISKKSHSKRRQRARQIRWTPEEDERVRYLIAKFGKNWTVIAKVLDNRTGKQVRDRYNNFLRSDILTTKFTTQEDALLLQLYEEFGNRWVQIAEQMPGRTECQVKNRYYGYLKKGECEEVCSFRKREKSPVCIQQDTSSDGSESEEVVNDLTSAISYAVQSTSLEEEESDEFRKLAKIILAKNLTSESAVEEELVETIEKKANEIEGEQLELEAGFEHIGLDPEQRVKELLERKAAIEYFYKKVLRDLDELGK